jgi:predicted RND superfamily exporter protein
MRQEMQNFKDTLIDFSLRRYKQIATVIVLLTLIFGAFFPMITIDTDPENMLETTEPVRVFHNESKAQFDLSETIILSIINEHDSDGVFNPTTLNKVYRLTEFAKNLQWKDPSEPDKMMGVIEAKMIAPSMVDHMSQEGPGTIRFEWLMQSPPKTREEALAIRDKALSNPLLKGQMISEDGKALSIYLPLTDKLLSYRVYAALTKKVAEFKGDEEYHIAGLPVAESAIGVEMFNQMTFAAPLTMAVIFGLLLIFFQKWVLIILPIIVATVSVVIALGLMIAMGYPVHILSSMLPIFLMPIAICDTVHVLSDFFESYTKEKGRKETIREVMGNLFMPTLYTSLTTAAGFLSFLTTSIPPARVFGVFVGFGVLVAWVVTVFLIPAYIMMIPDRVLENFGKSNCKNKNATWAERFLQSVGNQTYKRAKLFLAIIPLLILLAVIGISKISVNDNYAKRFTLGHPIRQADIAINKHFGGTYTAHLILEEKNSRELLFQDSQRIKSDLYKILTEIGEKSEFAQKIIGGLENKLFEVTSNSLPYKTFIEKANNYIDEKMANAPEEEAYFLEEVKSYLDLETEKLKLFKQPAMLQYLSGMQAYLKNSGIIGKSTSISDIVCKVNQELNGGAAEQFRIPDKMQGISECYMQYQQSHRPNDLWHMVTPDYMRANVWVQFTRGDSLQTEKAVHAVDEYIKTHKPPFELTYRWSGLHYVNLVFQNIMFWQMLESFGGTLIIVFIMMALLFRSVTWAIASMIPLTLTIATIYGVTGLLGKDYDMPVAVMSTIALGIAVDFAVHFLERSRQIFSETGSWEQTISKMFGEPALAISRNVLVVAFGFFPLMVAQLVPYKTTAILLFGILFFSGIMTLLLLPSLITVAEKQFFRKRIKK